VKSMNYLPLSCLMAIVSLPAPGGAADAQQTESRRTSDPLRVAPIDEVAGVYAVRQDKPFDRRIYQLDITGVSLRTYWRNIEPQRDQFDWSLFDDAIARCVATNKKVRLCIMFGTGVPKWVDVPWFTGSPDSEYDTANQPMPVPWHETLIREQKRINRIFAERYRDNPTVSFFHISGPSSIWEELALPANIVDQQGYSRDAILNTWKQVIDQWQAIRGGKRLSCAVSAATSVYRNLGDDIATYAVGKHDDPTDHGVVGSDFVLQWNYLDTLYGRAILATSKRWIPKTTIAWQMWGSTAWSRKCQDYEGTVKLGLDVGSTYVEVYQEDLLVPQYARFTETIDKEIKARIKKHGKAVVAIDQPPAQSSSARANGDVDQACDGDAPAWNTWSTSARNPGRILDSATLPTEYSPKRE